MSAVPRFEAPQCIALEAVNRLWRLSESEHAVELIEAACMELWSSSAGYSKAERNRLHLKFHFELAEDLNATAWGVCSPATSMKLLAPKFCAYVGFNDDTLHRFMEVLIEQNHDKLHALPWYNIVINCNHAVASLIHSGDFVALPAQDRCIQGWDDIWRLRAIFVQKFRERRDAAWRLYEDERY